MRMRIRGYDSHDSSSLNRDIPVERLVGVPVAIFAPLARSCHVAVRWPGSVLNRPGIPGNSNL
jgi:hypothetical protein